MNIIEELSKAVGNFLIPNNLRISVAESCTGGLIGATLTEIAGSSAYFRGGVIAYDNQIKKDILNVPQHVLDNFGAVSDQTVIAMAEGVCKLFKTECAISVSGIAGPGGGTETKPVGLVFIAISFKDKVKSFRFIFSGDRQEIRTQATRAALEQLLAFVRQFST
ncbi:MAG TPA: CinA family protein [Chitinispirillaceae bacterium]|nr:CinA family protein [Chitinispirillaceae bacterium]